MNGKRDRLGQAFAAIVLAFGRAVLASQLCLSFSRVAKTCALASSMPEYTFVPLIALQGLQHATRFSGVFLPLCARGTTKSTVIISAFSKLSRPSNPQ